MGEERQARATACVQKCTAYVLQGRDTTICTCTLCRQQEQVGPGPPSDHASTSTIPGSLVAALELADSATVVDTLRTIARGEVTLTEVQRQELLRRVTLPEPSVLSSLGPQLGRGQYLVREATLTTGGKVEPVAVKIMLENDAHLAEVVLSKRLSAVCKMVCKAHGAARKDGKLLLVMERCTGSLTDMLRERDGPVTQAELAMAAQDICAAVAELHACGIVHCDIKPANCLVRENGTVVLCDFGSAKVRRLRGCTRVSGHVTRLAVTWCRAAGSCVLVCNSQGMAADVQLPMGMTYAYAPMDQMANNDPSQPGEALAAPSKKCSQCLTARLIDPSLPLCAADKAWDVYAVAATLAHLATGKRPFEGIGPHVISVEHHKGRALQHRHLEEVPDALR